MYDVIVVGARCAGSPTAMLLARKGYRVVVLDRATFPSDRLSTHYIQPSGLARLRRWGLLDRLVATGCPPISEAVWWIGDALVRGFAPEEVAYAPRRTRLDSLLVDAARESGAQVREGFTVRELIFEGDRVVGVRGGVQGDNSQTLTAPIVVGADGRYSTVARGVQAPEYEVRPALTVVYYTYWRGLDPRLLTRNEVYIAEDNQIGVIPTHDDAVLIQAARPSSWFGQYRSDIEGHYHQAIAAAAPDLARDIAENGVQTERFYGTGALENFYRKPYGPGWALVGDAGFHKDPLTGQGISDAWRDAELLTEAVDAALSGRQEWDTALAGYETTRNVASEALYEFTLAAASFDFDPLTRQILRVLSENREHADRFFGLIAGTVPAEDFFSPDNLMSMLRSLPADAFAEEADLVGEAS